MLSPARKTLIALLLGSLWLLAPDLAGAFAAHQEGGIGPPQAPLPETSRPWPELPPTPARLRVRRGWVSMIADAQPERVGVHNRARTLDGATFLSLASDSVVELRWAGRGSLRITGPAELEWDPPRRAREPLRVRFLSWRSIDAESRRGAGLEVVLQSEAWCVSGTAAAWQLTRGLGGTSNLRHHGGLPLVVKSLVPGAQQGVVREVRSGGRLLLPAPEPVAIPRSRSGR